MSFLFVATGQLFLGVKLMGINSNGPGIFSRYIHRLYPLQKGLFIACWCDPFGCDPRYLGVLFSVMASDNSMY